jgi:hypothetical protein
MKNVLKLIKKAIRLEIRRMGVWKDAKIINIEKLKM